jgi:hypothetical protein
MAYVFVHHVFQVTIAKLKIFVAHKIQIVVITVIVNLVFVFVTIAGQVNSVTNKISVAKIDVTATVTAMKLPTLASVNNVTQVIVVNITMFVVTYFAVTMVFA